MGKNRTIRVAVILVIFGCHFVPSWSQQHSRVKRNFGSCTGGAALTKPITASQAGALGSAASSGPPTRKRRGILEGSNYQATPVILLNAVNGGPSVSTLMARLSGINSGPGHHGDTKASLFASSSILPPPTIAGGFYTKTQANFDRINRNVEAFNNLIKSPGVKTAPGLSDLLFVNQDGRAVTCEDICSRPGINFGLVGICTSDYCVCNEDLDPRFRAQNIVSQFEPQRHQREQRCPVGQIYDPVTISCQDPRKTIMCDDYQYPPMQGSVEVKPSPVVSNPNPNPNPNPSLLSPIETAIRNMPIMNLIQSPSKNQNQVSSPPNLSQIQVSGQGLTPSQSPASNQVPSPMAPIQNQSPAQNQIAVQNPVQNQIQSPTPSQNLIQSPVQNQNLIQTPVQNQNQNQVQSPVQNNKIPVVSSTQNQIQSPTPVQNQNSIHTSPPSQGGYSQQQIPVQSSNEGRFQTTNHVQIPGQLVYQGAGGGSGGYTTVPVLRTPQNSISSQYGPPASGYSSPVSYNFPIQKYNTIQSSPSVKYGYK